jgi:hypothetical protein
MGIVNTIYFLGMYKVNVIIKADADSNEQVYTAEYSVYGDSKWTKTE